MFGSSFGFYYLFFLFGSIIYVVWKLKSCLLGLRCSTASLSHLRFSWTLEFKGVIFYPVDNIYSWKYVCMYVCLICMKKREKEHFQEVGKPFQVVVLFAVRIIHSLMFYVQPSFQILLVSYLFITIYICFPAKKRAFRSRTG